jgi:riboflavin kinase / FMN adenylyltransferase
MILREGLDGLRAISPDSVVSIGNFDGVHLGHRQIVRTCDALRAQSASGRVVVVTFEPHPLTVLKPELAPPRLTSPSTKRDLLASLGVDEYVVLPPTPDVLGFSAEAFWKLLKDESRVAHLVEGGTFTFGKGRGGTIARLREWSVGTDVGIHVVPSVAQPLLDLQIVPVSSSLIRFLIDGGRARDAAILLGRPYLLEGKIVPGRQRGRTIGAPTANLDCGEQLVPADGVYAARCTLDGTVYAVALSVGTMPTFGENQRQIEAFLLGFNGDLYGRILQVEVLDWVREQWKLGSAEALRVQIEKDASLIGEIVQTAHPARPIAIAAGA